MKGEQGFTLLELLVVVSLIAVLSTLGLTAFTVYKSDAAYSNAEQVVRHTRTAIEAGLNNLDNPPGPVNFAQAQPGEIQDAAGRVYLPGMQIPKNIRLSVSYDPTCTEMGCQADFVEARHCNGSEYLQWIRAGDGVDLLVEHIAGEGCA